MKSKYFSVKQYHMDEDFYKKMFSDGLGPHEFTIYFRTYSHVHRKINNILAFACKQIQEHIISNSK